MEQEFYKDLAQRVRDLADRADPSTRRRLLKLAERYDAKGGRAGQALQRAERPLPIPRIPPTSIFTGPGEA
ncbi:DNA replication initiation complex subunit (GINS family) [Bradyrhizobium diazoefficiens]|jgi:hypothetical protein|uniref:DNA replication initiation complex subunit (GINS family) n=3 Tax=Bradyrhizobium TaxID=374 RepID=A0ABV4FJE6_9BRAD|nr:MULTISPECIES: hypothetical protein [Bradyrhizobium]MBR0867095.1 hypothetical protein [Bradyrhizobium diazoefficiens]MBR0891599.1 hypothetical protein [Bradyrhizobium diazoefficiens]MBR0923337.1 hypothetical protein [Bradyrhizobium diazoefficiens]MBR1070681.1 hypothetical protein [Bradyrhizobium liaoningense]MCP1768390.1 DNA replication initiation complex subunit (GINS family) [Bradyrhizobium japonicum]